MINAEEYIHTVHVHSVTYTIQREYAIRVFINILI